MKQNWNLRACQLPKLQCGYWQGWSWLVCEVPLLLKVGSCWTWNGKRSWVLSWASFLPLARPLQRVLSVLWAQLDDVLVVCSSHQFHLVLSSLFSNTFIYLFWIQAEVSPPSSPRSPPTTPLLPHPLLSSSLCRLFSYTHSLRILTEAGFLNLGHK